MKGLYKRIISGVLVLVTIFLMCSPVAFASSEGSLDSYKPTTFWDWAKSEDNLGWNFLKSLFDKDTCPKSPNTNGLHEFVKATTTIDGKTGLYYVCKYCGKSAGEVGKEVYQDQVADLPATGITSSGGLIWQARVANLKALSAITAVNKPLDFSSADPSADAFSWSHSNSYGYIYSDWHATADITNLPVSGSYCWLSCPSISLRGVRPDGTICTYTSMHNKGTFKHYDSTDTNAYIFCIYPDNGCPESLVSVSFLIHLPVFEIIPDSVIDFDSDAQYSVNSRPTTITGGNYGIVGDDNQVTTVTDNRQIVNETNNTYYNPATGQTGTITDWSYDYSSRIYNVTLDTGDKVSVEYGDENITIKEGDTSYTIYYIIQSSGGTCTHEWHKTGERQATCLVPAQRTYTCSICGEQKTETDSVLGHSWHAIKTVTTQYDESGNLTQEGYTIYECERCGEQYKSTNDTGLPPSSGGGSGGGTSNGIFSGIFGLIWDFCTFLFDLFSEFVVGGIKGFIDGLKDAGSSFFSILNPFNWDYGG